jgi:hypothetical protein
MMKSIAELKNIFKGQTIFLVGSGTSIDAYSPDFFKDKIFVGVNNVYRKIKVNYSIFTHHPDFCEALDKTECVVSEIDPSPRIDMPNFVESDRTFWMFKIGKYCAFEDNLVDVGKDDTLCLGNTISIVAMNFAAHLGASTIVMVGFDCCAIDGKINYEGYAPKIYFLDQIRENTIEAFRQYQNDLFVRNKKEIHLMSKKIKEVYGCDTVYLSPFIGLKNSDVLLSDYLTLKDFEAMCEEK